VERAAHYVRSGDGHVAYQVTGEGPPLVFVPGWFSHVELAWEIPRLAHFLDRLSSFCRLITIDKRGTGLSDPLPAGAPPTLEQRMDDVRAVMDAVGAERAALLGVSEGGPMATLFAATYPERTAGLVLLGTFARVFRAPDYPIGREESEFRAFLADLEEQWGTGVGLRALAPTLGDDPEMRASWGRYQRMSVSPRAATELLRLNALLDVRHVLGAIRVPTLVLHRAADRFVAPELGRYLAEHIPGARYVELPGEDHLYFVGDTDRMLDEIEVFVTGERGEIGADRVLATVLFTDIVDSTRRAAAAGDRAWLALLDRHDAMVRRQVERFRGRAVQSTGDGFLATFDGPARGVRCAVAVTQGARQLGLEVRAGVHTGECEIRGDDVAGIAVHIGARVAALAGAGEVLVSSTVKDLVAGSGLTFTARGRHTLKGVPGDWALYAAAV
jgi:pimeloyl-ACP methyl ester carboxylesterase